ncbi:MAG: glycosyltransferase family 4 protein [Clostridiales bacterium]|nr:glycosyltransferase family 4 protein [Clostridiales bacterium]
MMLKKVLYTASTFSHLKNFHLPYLKFFQENGWEVTVMAGGENKSTSYADVVLSIPFEKKMMSPRNFILTGKMARIIKKEHYDIICTHTALAAFFTRLAIMLSGKKKPFVINTSHGYLFDNKSTLIKKNIMLLAEKLMAPVTDVVFTMNKQDTEIAIKHRLAKKDVVQIKGMGVDFGRFGKLLDKAAKEKLGIREENFILVYAAEFSKRKNQKMLINAMKDLPENIRLFLLGDGSLLEDCKELVKSLGLETRVFFPGYISDISEYYQVSDICVSSSRIEGLPFNIMEGMAAGLPIVASKVKGHEDLITVGANGYLYEYDHIDQFQAAVMDLYKNREKLTEIGQKNRLSVQQYSLNTVYPEITNLFLKYIRDLR